MIVSVFCNRALLRLNSRPTTFYRSIQTCVVLDKKKGIQYPFGASKDWAIKKALPDIDQDNFYTHEPLPYVKTGGRGENGQVQFKHVGGGLKRPFFMVDKRRNHELLPERAYTNLNFNHLRGWLTSGTDSVAKEVNSVAKEEGECLTSQSAQDSGNCVSGEASVIGIENEKVAPPREWKEKVIRIHETWWRSEHIALVANGIHKRWIRATQGMKVGDVITSYAPEKGPNIYQPKPGDSYAVGRLVPGTIISQLEDRPGNGARFLIKAGARGIIVKHDISANATFVKLDSDVATQTSNTKKKKTKKKKVRANSLIMVSSACTAVAGCVSNVAHNTKRFKTWGEKSWHGYRPGSGFNQKKMVRFGRNLNIRGSGSIDYTKEEKKDDYGRLAYGELSLKLPGRAERNEVKKNAIHVYKSNYGEEFPQYQYDGNNRIR